MSKSLTNGAEALRNMYINLTVIIENFKKKRREVEKIFKKHYPELKITPDRRK